MDTLFNLSIINKVHLQIDKLQSKLVMLDPNYVYTRWPGPDFYCIHCTMWLWTSYYTWLQPFGQEDPKSPQSKTRFETSLPSWYFIHKPSNKCQIIAHVFMYENFPYLH